MTVQEAYAEVERITRREAKNFAYGIMVLPREKRRAIAASAASRMRGAIASRAARPAWRRRERRASWSVIMSLLSLLAMGCVPIIRPGLQRFNVR
jgi:phytoene/squalene synthetase